jgi:hypothetical protein
MRPGAQACHQIGKWHCGMSIDAHLPINRGFASSFGYLAGAEDHFKDTRGDFVDLWRSASPAFGENGTVGAVNYRQPSADAGETTVQFVHFLYNTNVIILPRQARDEHRESTQKRVPFFVAAALSLSRIPKRARSERSSGELYCLV